MCPEEEVINPSSNIFDATHSHSRSNPYSALEVLRERSKHLCKTVYAIDEETSKRMPRKNDSNELEKELVYCKELEKIIESDQVLQQIPSMKEKLNLLKETVEDTLEHYTLSKDTEARTGHKSADSSFFGCKTHLAMSEERIITAAVVTSGEKGEGPELPKLVEISQANGIQIETVLGDAAYSGKENLLLLYKQAWKEVQVLTRRFFFLAFRKAPGVRFLCP